MSRQSTITIERPTPKLARIVFANPPVNMIVAETVTRLDLGPRSSFRRRHLARASPGAPT